MATTRNPKHGSMQFWPRKRAGRIYARVRTYANIKEPKIAGFAGYKVGMCHVSAFDSRKNSRTKGTEIVFPVTVVECPPLKIASVRFYKKDNGNWRVVSEIPNKVDKELERKIIFPKKSTKSIDDIKPETYDDVRVNVYTQPKLTGIGKKKPELFEVALGGTKEQKLAYIKENLAKEIAVSDIFKDGQKIDIHGVTKGKGFQGPVKRFSVAIRQHKAEKTKRGPATLGGWVGHGHFMYRVAHAGQMGFHQRTFYNCVILKIGKKDDKINPQAGFMHYGLVKNPYVLVWGSVPGPQKRMIRMNFAQRADKKAIADLPELKSIMHNSS